MYLTVLRMSKANIRKQLAAGELTVNDLLDLTDGESMHKWLTGRQNAHRAEEHILYRVMSEQDASYIYIQSDSPFHTEKIEKRGLEVVKQEDRAQFFGDNCKGTRVVFCTLVTPMKEAGEGRKKEYIEDGDARAAWLGRKLREGGLEVVGLSERATTFIRFTRRGREVRIPANDYIGMGVICDPDRFKDMVQQGIGKHKNYGAGMLLVTD